MSKLEVIAMIENCQLLNQQKQCPDINQQLANMALAIKLNECFLSGDEGVSQEDYACLLDEAHVLQGQLMAECEACG